MIVHGICKDVCSDMALAEKARLVPPAHGPICLTIHEFAHQGDMSRAECLTGIEMLTAQFTPQKSLYTPRNYSY